MGLLNYRNVLPTMVQLIDENDLLDITGYQKNMEENHIYNLILILVLKVKTMMDSAAFLDDVIGAWLQKEDKVTEKGEPSWTVLVNALKHPRVGQTGTADIITGQRTQVIRL